MAIKCRVVVQIGPNGVLELLCRAHHEEFKQTAAWTSESWFLVEQVKRANISQYAILQH